VELGSSWVAPVTRTHSPAATAAAATTDATCFSCCYVLFMLPAQTMLLMTKIPSRQEKSVQGEAFYYSNVITRGCSMGVCVLATWKSEM
jgi:hypothetical protein